MEDSSLRYVSDLSWREEGRRQVEGRQCSAPSLGLGLVSSTAEILGQASQRFVPYIGRSLCRFVVLVDTVVGQGFRMLSVSVVTLGSAVFDEHPNAPYRELIFCLCGNVPTLIENRIVVE